MKRVSVLVSSLARLFGWAPWGDPIRVSVGVQYEMFDRSLAWRLSRSVKRLARGRCLVRVVPLPRGTGEDVAALLSVQGGRRREYREAWRIRWSDGGERILVIEKR